MILLMQIVISITIVPVKLKSVNEIHSVSKGYYLKTVIPELDTLPKDSSIVFIGYTPSKLVVFVKNYQKGIHASSRRRDAEGVVRQSEDCFYITLATHGIGEDAYFIGVNPLGAIADRVISPSGITEWDGDISVKTRITAYGWEALLVIPFSTISYNETYWGIDFMRVITGKNLKVQVLVPKKNLGDWINIAKMKLDFSYIKRTGGVSVLFIPSLRFTSNNGERKLEGGITARWKEGVSSLLETTVYPDYSELEADIQEFDLNQLPVNYPEKRPFFIEGRSFYTPPFTLMRTRNIDLPKFGVKFYSTTEKSIFTVYALNTNLVFDTTYDFLEFFRYAYNFTKATRAGAFGLISEKGYNLASADFTTYLSPFDVSISSEIARVTDGGATFRGITIERNVSQGWGGFITFEDIDSGFLSPYNYIQFNFDGIRWISGNIGYSRYIKKKDRVMFFGAKAYGRRIVDRYSGDRIMQLAEPMVFFGPSPWMVFLEVELNELDYLKAWNPYITDVSVKMPGIGISYHGSTWKNFTIYASSGNYAGEKAYYYTFSLRYNLFERINIGTYDYRVIIPALNQNMAVVQVFGEVSPGYHIFIKPYINLTGNCGSQKVLCSLKDKSLNINVVMGYEPSYLSGIYFAFNRTSGEDESKKFVLKFQIAKRLKL